MKFNRVPDNLIIEIEEYDMRGVEIHIDQMLTAPHSSTTQHALLDTCIVRFGSSPCLSCCVQTDSAAGLHCNFLLEDFFRGGLHPS